MNLFESFLFENSAEKDIVLKKRKEIEQSVESHLKDLTKKGDIEKFKTSKIASSQSIKYTIHTNIPRAQVLSDFKNKFKNLKPLPVEKIFSGSDTPGLFLDTGLMFNDTGVGVGLIFKDGAAVSKRGVTNVSAAFTEAIPALMFNLNYKAGYNVSTHDDMYKLLGELIKSLETGKADKTLLGKNSKNDLIHAFSSALKNNSAAQFNFEKTRSGVLIFNELKRIEKTENRQWDYAVFAASKKPSGIQSNHPGDLFLKLKGNGITASDWFGVSLKDGTPKSTEPHFNSYLNSIFKTHLGFAGADEMMFSAIWRQGKSKLAKFFIENGMKEADVFKNYGTKWENFYNDFLNKNVTNDAEKEKIVNEIYRDTINNFRLMLSTFSGIMQKDKGKLQRLVDWLTLEVFKIGVLPPYIVLKSTGTSVERVEYAQDFLKILQDGIVDARFYLPRGENASVQDIYLDVKSANGLVGTFTFTVRSRNSKMKAIQYPGVLLTKFELK